MSYLVGWALNW